MKWSDCIWRISDLLSRILELGSGYFIIIWNVGNVTGRRNLEDAGFVPVNTERGLNLIELLFINLTAVSSKLKHTRIFLSETMQWQSAQGLKEELLMYIKRKCWWSVGVRTMTVSWVTHKDTSVLSCWYDLAHTCRVYDLRVTSLKLILRKGIFETLMWGSVLQTAITISKCVCSLLLHCFEFVLLHGILLPSYIFYVTVPSSCCL
jgi:hypothetical protein